MNDKILGIDFGTKKIGLAIADSETKLAEPLQTIHFESSDGALEKIKRVVADENIGKVVLGVSAGKMAETTKKFGKKLEDILAIPVIYQDERLTTKEAQRLSIEAGIKRKKRKSLEDAYSATLILQSFLDVH
jgi:putative Holliday junction resolvase